MNKLAVFIFVLLLGCQKSPSVQKTDLLGMWQLETIRVGEKAINLSGKPMDLGDCLSQWTLTFGENNIKITVYPTAYDCEDSEFIENEIPYQIKKMKRIQHLTTYLFYKLSVDFKCFISALETKR